MAKRGRPRKIDSGISQNDLYNIGYKSFCDGLKINTCPYTIDSKSGKHWRAGFYAALHDDKISNPAITTTQKDDKK